MSVFKATKENILLAAETIKNGGLVSFPTETVYGLGGDLFNTNALAKIFEAKQRPEFDPLITHISDKEMLFKLIKTQDKKLLNVLEKLIEKFWPGSLTLILPKKNIVPNLATSGLPTFAVRMPNNEIALELIRKSTGAIAAPSANPFGYLSPTSAEHVEEQLGDEIDMILDGGKCDVGVESTVLDITKDNPIILRPGALSYEELKDVLPDLQILDRKATNLKSPGQLENHYSPRKPLKIIKLNEIEKYNKKNEKIGLLSFSGQEFGINFKKKAMLSENDSLVEAASNLFEKLHFLDKQDIDIIYVEKIPEIGIGMAIMDRIYKASKK